jgi:hypothetical protein
MNNEINLLEYIYDDQVKVEIPGSLLYALMQVLNQVKENETQYVFTHYYNEAPKTVKGLNDLVEKVETTLTKYPSATAYFNQEPQIATSMLGNAALDLLMLVQQVHSEQIEKGNALKVGSIQTPKKDDVKLS